MAVDIEKLKALARDGDAVTLTSDIVRKLIAELEAARAVLREVEWTDSDDVDMCPACRASRDEGHAADCALARAIGC